jgi:hypothetical protein
MSQQLEQPPQLLAELLPAGLYEAPLASQEPTLVVLEVGEPLRIRFQLEGGYELDIPMTPDAIDGFARLAQTLSRRRR